MPTPLCSIALTLTLLTPAHAQGGLRRPARASFREEPVSLGVATSTNIVTGNGFFAFTIGEQQNGVVDLNGDGDVTDLVLHVFDTVTRTLSSPRLAAGPLVPATVGDRLVFSVDERDQAGADLNGDGDAIDRVAHVYDHRTGKVRNLGVAVLNTGDVQHTDDFVLLLVRENAGFGSGQNLDLNGDGDAIDQVAHVLSLTDGVLVNLGLAIRGNATPRWIAPGRAVLPVSESDQGALDRNGDGDTVDTVLHTYALEDHAVWNTGVAGEPLGFAAGSLIGFANEDAEGADRNGDGDRLDLVLHRFDPRHREVWNEGLAAHGSQVALDPISGPRAAVLAHEAGQGSTDLNGDGDADDFVLHVYHGETRDLTNLGLAVVAGGTPRALPAFDHGLLAFWVEESGQGSTDLNGNGNALDIVLHVHDTDPGLTTNLGLAAQLAALRVDRGLVTFPVSEPAQGLDLNGDGDAQDLWVLHAYDRRTGRTTHLGLSGHRDRFETGRGYVSVLVDETTQGAGDLNGDGDEQDVVHHLYEARSGSLRNVGLACVSTLATPVFFGPGPALVLVAEDGEGRDLNGDGDQLDTVPFVLGL